MKLGIDISYAQGIVDFEKLKSQKDFVIIRATYGVGYVDTQFERNKSEARRVGIQRGYYHYAYPQFNSPESEADWFCKHIDLQNGEFLALDLEEAWSGDKVDFAKRFLDKVSQYFNGYKPFFYSYFSYIKSLNWSPVINAGYPLWLALYDYNTNIPPSLGWPQVVIKQFTDKDSAANMGTVDGDVSYFNLSNYTYKNMAKHEIQIEGATWWQGDDDADFASKKDLLKSVLDNGAVEMSSNDGTKYQANIKQQLMSTMAQIPPLTQEIKDLTQRVQDITQLVQVKTEQVTKAEADLQVTQKSLEGALSTIKEQESQIAHLKDLVNMSQDQTVNFITKLLIRLATLFHK